MKDDPDLNLPLRTEILKIALDFEYRINNYLLAILSIDNPKRSTLSNRSGSISFKNKIDLLFDLDILTKEENEKFQIIMEFRNQFMHNYECCSFTDAVARIAGSRNKLLKYCNDNTLTDEFQLQNAFDNMYKECLSIMDLKMKERDTLIAEKLRSYNNLLELQTIVFRRYIAINKEISELCQTSIDRDSKTTPTDSSPLESIIKLLSDDLCELNNSEEFRNLLAESRKLHTPEKFRDYFKK